MINDKTYFLKSNHQLFDATLGEFSSRPFELASLNEIIKRSNSNKGSFYYRFSDKQELYFALVDDMFTQQISYVNSILYGLVSKLTLKEQLLILFQSLLNLNKLDSRYLFFNKLLYHEDKNLLDQIKENCVYSPIERLFSAIDLTKSNFFLDLNLLKESILHFYSVFVDYALNSNFNLEDYVDFILFRDHSATKSIQFEDKYCILDVKNLNYTFQLSNNSIHQMTFQLYSGEIFAFVGDDFSGKSTITRLLAGQLKKYEGSISFVDSESVNRVDVPGILLTSDKPVFHLRKTVFQNIESMKKAYALDIDVLKEMEELGLEGMGDILFRDISSELQTLLMISKAIWQNPKIVIVSYALNSLNAYHLGLISRKLLKCKAKGSTIVLIDSKLDYLIDFADRIAFIDQGSIKKIEYTSDLKKKYTPTQVIIRYAVGGLEYIKTIPLSEVNTSPFQKEFSKAKLIEMKMIQQSYEDILKIEIGEQSNEEF